MIKCAHGIEGMQIIGTIIGFGCDDCISDAQGIVSKTVEDNLDSLPNPPGFEEEDDAS
mgnify:CR=1 FL=1|tara:strand:+ start:1337 stop:1510 length:174 start_codon:yes stop_codon:yes gene_type:complete